MKGLAPQTRRPESDALSLHTTPDDYDYDSQPELDLPPSYADSEVAAGSSSAPEPVRFGLPELVLTHHEVVVDDYCPVPQLEGWKARFEALPIDSKETSIRIDPRLQDPYVLYAYIMDCVRARPPVPMIKIHGSHEEVESKAGKPKEKTKRIVTDFDIEVSLRGLLSQPHAEHYWGDYIVRNDESVYRGSFRKKRAPGQHQPVQVDDIPTPDLKEWCERYCASKSKLKVFRISKKVSNLDHEYLKNAVSEMVRSTDYDGELAITFPIHDQNLDIYSPHWVNLWRTSWVARIFYYTMLWILIWPVLYFMTKWYTVYDVYWSTSEVFRDPQDPRRGFKRFATISERDWFSTHRGYLRHLVLQKHQGAVHITTDTINEWNRSTAANRSRR